jgi:hypothetical protein
VTEQEIVWLPENQTRRGWNGKSEFEMYEGSKWSMLAAQITGTRRIHGDAAALNLLKQWQNTNLTIEAVQRAYTGQFVAAPNSIFLTTSDKGTPAIRANPSYLEWTTQQQREWALGICGILTEMNNGHHALLGGEPVTPENRENQKTLLNRWWNVNSRDDLLDKLTWIELGGHRQEFEKFGEALKRLDASQASNLMERAKGDLELQNRIDIVNEYRDKLEKKSLIGWDYSRYVALCGWGVVAGYISETEAWEHIMPVARMVQQTFDSWDDLGANYLVGRRFWSYRQTVRTGLEAQDAYKRLCTDTNSPWCRYPWATPLPRMKNGK